MKHSTVALAILCLGLWSCKDSFKQAENVGSLTPTPTPSAQNDIQFTGGRRLSISGRTMGQVGNASTALASLPGVSVLAIVNGVSYKTTSSADGGWAVRDVPLRPKIDPTNGDDNLPTVVIYLDKPGWSPTFDADLNTPGTQIQNWVAIRIDANMVDTQGNYHATWPAPMTFAQGALKVTSSVIKASSVLNDRWLQSGDSVGRLSSEFGEAFMIQADTQISLTFNVPVDTTYNTNFVEFYKPSGAAQAFSGAWDSTGTIYTITPTGLIPSNDESQRYQIRIARPVRSFDADFLTRRELENVTMQFAVLKSGRDTLLLASAPTLFPQGDGIGYAGYFFDAGTIYKTGYRASVNVIDVVTDSVTDATQNDICIQWNQNSLARSTNGYRIYARAPGMQYGRWIDTTSVWSIPILTGDGKAYACITNPYTRLASGTGVLTGTNQFQLVVAPVDTDGNEGSLANVTTPLTIADNWGPALTAAAWNKATVASEPDDYFSLNPSSLLSLTFSEPLDPWTATQTTTVLSLSGLIGAVGSSQFALSAVSPSQASLKLALTFQLPSTTLLLPGAKTSTTLTLSSLSQIRKGSVLKVIGSSLNYSENVTVADVKSFDNSVILTAPLSKTYPAGSSVRLIQGEAGQTSFISTLSSKATAADLVINVGNASNFVPTESIKIWVKDEEGTPSALGPFTITSVGATTLTLGSAVGGNAPSGSWVVDAAVTAAEILPRVGNTWAQASDLQWSGGSAATTLAIDNFAAAPDAQTSVVLVNNTSNIAQGDMVTVAGSNVSANLSVKAIPTDTTLTFAAHGFKVGDTLRIQPVAIRVSAVLASATTITLASANPVALNESVVLTDPAFETSASAGALAAATSLTVADASGIAVGQSITVDSGVEAAESVTVSAVVGNVLTISALTNNHGAGARVTRNQVSETRTVAADSAGTLVTTDAITGFYSAKTILTDLRNSLDRAVTAVSPTTVTIAAVPASTYFPVGTTVNLLSLYETRQITGIQGNLLTLSAALAYSHRAGATVTKPTQIFMKTTAADMSKFMIGDQIVCDSLSAIPGAHNDRFEGMILGFDTAQSYVTLSTTATGLITTTNLTCSFLGDAVKIQGVLDSNGQVIRATWGNKSSLQAVGIVR